MTTQPCAKVTEPAMGTSHYVLSGAAVGEVAAAAAAKPRISPVEDRATTTTVRTPEPCASTPIVAGRAFERDDLVDLPPRGFSVCTGPVVEDEAVLQR